MLVADRKDGAAVCEAWKNNTSGIYMQLMKTFYDVIKNKEDV